MIVVCLLAARPLPGTASGPSAFATPGGAIPRAGPLRGSLALTLGLGLAPALAPALSVAAKDQWREDIPRVLKGLRLYQQQWPEINAEGLATVGANRVREGLTIKFADALSVTVPAGEPLGINIFNCQVTAVKKPELGWLEGDSIIAVNGAPTRGSDVDLQNALQAAKAAGQPMQITYERKGPPLLDGLENKLKLAYGDLADDNLPELEDVQISVGDLKGAAALAASATSVSPETMRRLRQEIDKLAGLVTPIAKAIG